jgi:hypothetical protein
MQTPISRCSQHISRKREKGLEKSDAPVQICQTVINSQELTKSFTALKALVH